MRPVAAGSGSGSFSVDQNGGEDVVIDVTGAVAKPGVYRLPAGSRVNDAVSAPAGATGAGDVERSTWRRGSPTASRWWSRPRAQAAAVAAGATRRLGDAERGPISLGTATVEELDTIEGIGPVTAQNIVDFRDEHGGVSSVDELDQISGIGPATMDALRARLQP